MRSQALEAGLIAQNQSALRPFRLYRPTSVTEALEIVRAHNEITVTAGCSDFVAQLREGRAPSVLLSLSHVKELATTDYDSDTLRIGPMVTHYAGSTHPAVAAAIPNLARAWSSIATVRIRYTGTVGGNLLARRFRYEMPGILDSLNAELIFRGGSRTHAAVDSLWEHARGGLDGRAAGAWRFDGLLTQIEVDTSTLVWFGYERSMRPLATVALAIRRQPDSKLVVSATAGSEYRRYFALHCSTGTEQLVDVDTAQVGEELGRQLPDEAADYSGSIEYRRHLVSVLSRRLLASAVAESEK